MATGEIISTATGKATITKIKAMQSKWGLPQINDSIVNTGNNLQASTPNAMIDAIIAGKNKSGWTGTISDKVSVGQIITDIFASLNTQADAITSHCPCNCNHCSCNCNKCSCDCNHCDNCSSSCDHNNPR